MGKRKDFNQTIKMREMAAFEHTILEAERIYDSPSMWIVLKCVKGFPTDDPVDYVCLECSKWMSEVVG